MFEKTHFRVQIRLVPGPNTPCSENSVGAEKAARDWSNVGAPRDDLMDAIRDAEIAKAWWNGQDVIGGEFGKLFALLGGKFGGTLKEWGDQVEVRVVKEHVMWTWEVVDEASPAFVKA